MDISGFSECFIVAGGPSLKGFNWSLLDGKFVIAVNRSYEVLPNAQIVYFTDDDWWKTHHPKLLKHSGKLIKGCLPNKQIKHPQVTEYVLTGPHYLDMAKGNLRHGHNSTYAAVNLAVQLGFKKIYLLGVDMKWGTKNDKATSHWHDGHRRLDPESVYKKMMECFKTMVEPLKKEKVEVINLNPNSMLTTFPKMNPSEVFGDKYVQNATEATVADSKLLGDRVEQALELLGGKQIASAIEKVTKKPCNCAKRKEALNRFHRRLTSSVTPARIEPVAKPAQPAPRTRLQPRLMPRAPRK